MTLAEFSSALFSFLSIPVPEKQNSDSESDTPFRSVFTEALNVFYKVSTVYSLSFFPRTCGLYESPHWL